MRALSPHGGYSIQLIEADERVMQDVRGFAMHQVLSKPVIANFQQTGLLDYEIEAALTHFNFSGIPEGVNPLTRISSFDTETFVMQSYPEKERDAMVIQLDQRLRELQELNPNEFIIVDPPDAPKPWPGYDDDSVEDVLKIQEQTGIKAETIRLYELENANREEIVTAMQMIEDPSLAGAEEPEEAIVVESV